MNVSHHCKMPVIYNRLAFMRWMYSKLIRANLFIESELLPPCSFISASQRDVPG